MKLKVNRTVELIVPSKTKVITNDEWITLARRVSNGVIGVITFQQSDIYDIDFNDDDNWTLLYDEELDSIKDNVH